MGRYVAGRSRHIRGARIVLVAGAALLLCVPPGIARAQSAQCTPDPTWGLPDRLVATQMLLEVNVHRASLGLGALEVSPTLVAAAEWKAAHMAATGYFFHHDPDRTLSERISDCGYSEQATENLGWGYLTPAETLSAWLSSEGHRAHVEDPRAVVTGIAMVRSDAGLPYWVQVFGMVDEAAAAPAEPVGVSAPDDVAEPAHAPDPTHVQLGRRSLRSGVTRIDPRH